MPTLSVTWSKAIRPALALFLILLFMATPTFASAGHIDEGSPARQDEDPIGMRATLYLGASSVLSPAFPDGGTDESATFRAGVGVNGLDLGTWTSKALEADLSVNGKVQVVLWAQGSGLQQSTFFGCYVSVAGTQVSGDIHTATSALSSTATEYKAENTLNFNATKGQTISITLKVHERGTGGEVLYGSSSHPSGITFTTMPVSTSTYAEEHKAGRSLLVRTYVEDAWGVDDVESVDQFIAGPYETRDLGIDPSTITEDKIIARADPADQMQTDATGGTVNVSWLWTYEGMKSGGKTVKPGIYYLVGIVHCKGGDRVFTDAGTVVLSEPAPLFGTAGNALLLAFIIGALAVGVYFYALRTSRLKTDKGRAVATVLMVSVIVGAGMYAFMVAVPQSSSEGGETAPDFTVTTTAGTTLKMSSQRGKVVLIDLMATWCPSCNAEMSTLVKLHQKYKGAVFISVSVEGSGDNVEGLKTFKAKYGADWDFAMDTDKVWQRYQDISQPFIPTIVIVNPQGKLTFREIGEVSFKELSAQMEKASKGGFDIGISTQGTNIMLVAFITGVLAFFSPCAFPLLPGYMGYVLSRQEQQVPGKGGISMKRSVIGGILAASGALLLFLLAGLLVAAAGSTVVAYIPYLTPVIAIIIVIIGLLILLGRTGWMDKLSTAIAPVTSKMTDRIDKASSTGQGGRGGYRGLFLYGLGYGVAAMGCHAPVFIAILMAGFAAGGFVNALLVFVAFGIGMGVMMVTVTVLVGMAKGMVIKRMQNAMPLILRLSGLVLLIAGLYLAFYSLNPILNAPAA